MAKLVLILVFGVALAGCGTSYQISRECDDANPLPASFQTGQVFGLLGMGAAYLTDGDSYLRVTQARTQCVEQKKAALAASQ